MRKEIFRHAGKLADDGVREGRETRARSPLFICTRPLRLTLPALHAQKDARR